MSQSRPHELARNWGEPTSQPQDKVLSRRQRSQRQHRRRGSTPLPTDPPPARGLCGPPPLGQKLPGHAPSSLPLPSRPCTKHVPWQVAFGEPLPCLPVGSAPQGPAGSAGQVRAGPTAAAGCGGSLPTSGEQQVHPDNRPEATSSNSYIKNKGDLFQFMQRVSLS